MKKSKTENSELGIADPNWIKGKSWDLNVSSLNQFFVVIGAGINGELKQITEFFKKPVSQNMPDWLLVELVESLDSRGDGSAVPEEIRKKYKSVLSASKSQKPQKRRVVLKDERTGKR